jgi:ribosome-binding protein aMBF1 (putative translation factor)
MSEESKTVGTPGKENSKVEPDNVRKAKEEPMFSKEERVWRAKIRKRSEEPNTVGTPEKENVKVEPNNVRKVREGLLLSKAELARRAKISVLTIDRVEKGMACRMDTKRKIILSLGLELSDRDKVFNKG